MLSDKNLLIYISTIEDKTLSYNTKSSEYAMRNRLELAKKLELDTKDIIYMNQVHQDNIEVVQSTEQNHFLETDALITNMPNIPLLVTVADCIPIFLYDKKQRAIALIHCGRDGTYLEIVTKVIGQMHTSYNTNSKDITAYFGPSINHCCYDIDKNIADGFRAKFGETFCIDDKLDLQAINKYLLVKSGVKKANIKISKICTGCSGELYYSYRKSGTTDRFAGIFMLKK
jgi:YfiH family protein